MATNLLSTAQAAKLIAERTGKPLSQRQLQHEIQLGYLKAEKIAGIYLIHPKDIERYQRRHRGVQAKKIKSKRIKSL